MADEIKISALPVIPTATLADVAPVVSSGVTYQESNQKVLDLFKQQIAFQRNNDSSTIDLTSANAVLSNPAATTFIVTGQPNGSRTITLPVSNASNSWPRGTNNILFINDGDYPVSIRYASSSGLATLSVGGVIQLALISNSISNGIFAALEPMQVSQVIGSQNLEVFFRETSTDTATAGRSTTYASGVDVEFLSFSQSAINYAMAQLKMPKRWDGGPFNLTIPWYSPDAATTGDVEWFVDAAILSDGSQFGDTSFGTVKSIVTSLPAALDVEVDVVVVDIAPATGSSTNNATLIIRVKRDGGVGSDTLPGNANILNGTVITYTATHGNDSY